MVFRERDQGRQTCKRCLFPPNYIIAMEGERIDPRGFLKSLSNQAMIPSQGTKGMFVEQPLCLKKI